MTPEAIDLSGSIDLLVAGDNVLAIHALNRTANDDRFLIEPRLSAGGAFAEVSRYFETPTPGAPNGDGAIDLVADTQFSVDRGFHTTPFDVEITSLTPGAEIRYTLDGSKPSESRGTLYSGPLSVTGTTTLRAIAYRTGYLSTNVDTHTYIFLDDVLEQRRPAGYPTTWAGNPADYDVDPEIATDTGSPHFQPMLREDLRSIPTVSIVMSQDDFVGSSRGIYTNPLNRGRAWEREASLEWIWPADDAPAAPQSFQLNCGARMSGNSSARPIEGKHNFRLTFRSEYGPTKLRESIFDPEDEDSVDGAYDTIVFRCFSTDSWHFKDGGSRYRRWDSQYIRDVWMRDSQLASGEVASHSTYVHLYVNGLYWGLYNPCERPDDEFHASYQGGDPEDWDIVKDFQEVQRGNRVAWDQMLALARSGLSSDAAYQRIQGNNPDGSPNPAFPPYVDVDNLIDFMLLHFYAGAEDWPHHNWYAGRNRTGDFGGWKFIVWDQEIVLDNAYRNRIGVSNDGSPALVYSRMRQNEEFRVRFGDRVQEWFFNGGLLTNEQATERWLRRSDQIDRAIVGESARWGDFREDIPDPSNSPAELYTREDHWLPERTIVLTERIPDSHRLALERLRAADLYPDVDAPRFSQHGGAIPEGFELGVSAPEGAVWYTLDGSDPRLPGGEISASAETTGPAVTDTLLDAPAAARYIVPTGPALGLDWTERDYNDSAWAAGQSAIGYDRQSGFEDFFESDVEAQMYDTNATLYLRVPFAVENPAALTFLSLSMRYDDGYIAYLNGTEVLRRNAPDNAEWDSRSQGSHADSAAVVFESFDISESLDTLVAGTNVLAIHALNATETSSDFLMVPRLEGSSSTGSGILLNETTRVRARALLGDTWSALVDATFFIDRPLTLRVTELNYHPPAAANGPFSEEDYEFLEIQNTGPDRVWLWGVHFTDGIEFDFDDSEIDWLDPGDVLVIAEDLQAFEERYGLDGILVAGQYGGNLGNASDTLRYEDPLGNTIQEFTYLDSWYPSTDGGGFTLEIRDASGMLELWSLRSGWQASGDLLGTPGEHEGIILPGGGLQRPGDTNQDGNLDISDPIALLRVLFAGQLFMPPCDGIGLTDGGNLAVLDVNGDTVVDISDAVSALAYLFAAGTPPALGQNCVEIAGCDDVCSP